MYNICVNKIKKKKEMVTTRQHGKEIKNIKIEKVIIMNTTFFLNFFIILSIEI